MSSKTFITQINKLQFLYLIKLSLKLKRVAPKTVFKLLKERDSLGWTAETNATQKMTRTMLISNFLNLFSQTTRAEGKKRDILLS